MAEGGDQSLMQKTNAPLSSGSALDPTGDAARDPAVDTERDPAVDTKLDPSVDAEIEAATAALVVGDRRPIDRWTQDGGYRPVRFAWGDAIEDLLRTQATPSSRLRLDGSLRLRPDRPADTATTAQPRGMPYRGTIEPSVDTVATVTGLLAWYRGLGRSEGGGLPAKAMIRPETLTPYLGHLLLLEVLGDGRDFYYRLYGSEVARTARMDPTGRYFSEIVPRTPLAFLYHVTYRAAVRRAEPLLCDHYAQAYLSAERWRRLILPFSNGTGTLPAPNAAAAGACGDGGKTRYLLVAKLPVGFKVEDAADNRFVDW